MCGASTLRRERDGVRVVMVTNFVAHRQQLLVWTVLQCSMLQDANNESLLAQRACIKALTTVRVLLASFVLQYSW